MDAIGRFFNSEEFMPHGHCFLWQPGILWLHVVSDVLIAIAYYSIPFALIYFVRKRDDIPFKSIFWLFGAFILLCGTTHLVSIWTLWYPEYAFEGVVKALTAIVSLGTFFVVVKMMPQALLLAGPAKLAQLNEELRARIIERDSAYALMEKKVEERTAELKRAMEDLKRSNQELQRFASVCSHDLQEPARMVGSYAQLLSTKYKDRLDDDANEFLHYLTDGADRMQAMIKGILSYARAGHMEQDVEKVDCNKIVGNILRDFTALIEERKADIACGKLPTVMADQVQMTQLFQNLIGNALKFQKPGEHPRIVIDAERQDGRWLFNIRDNGIGIHPQYLDKIFLIFQRLNRREEYEGTGIGLAVCKRIVESYGGHIWVEPNQPHGSIFYFTLPDKVS